MSITQEQRNLCVDAIREIEADPDKRVIDASIRPFEAPHLGFDYMLAVAYIRKSQPDYDEEPPINKMPTKIGPGIGMLAIDFAQAVHVETRKKTTLDTPFAEPALLTHYMSANNVYHLIRSRNLEELPVRMAESDPGIRNWVKRGLKNYGLMMAGTIGVGPSSAEYENDRFDDDDFEEGGYGSPEAWRFASNELKAMTVAGCLTCLSGSRALAETGSLPKPDLLTMPVQPDQEGSLDLLPLLRSGKSVMTQGEVDEWINRQLTAIGVEDNSMGFGREYNTEALEECLGKAVSNFVAQALPISSEDLEYIRTPGNIVIDGVRSTVTDPNLVIQESMGEREPSHVQAAPPPSAAPSNEHQTGPRMPDPDL